MLIHQLTGEEALAQGAWEAGVCVAAGYPGSPSTRFLERLAEISRVDDVYCEWSSNEKVAFEMALGASMAGKRASVSMKSVGLNVALDPLMVANLGGVSGGLVIILGDDPGAWGSQNEQDSRFLVRAAEVPLLEFSSPQEAYDMVQYAFSLSEKFELPVFVRETRSSANEKGAVYVKAERIQTSQKHFLELEPWKCFPENPPEKHRKLQAKIQMIMDEFNLGPFNHMVVKSSKGIIAVGFMAARVERLLSGKGGEPLSVFKIGTIYPLPEESLIKFLSQMEEILVAEELQPIVEDHLRSKAHLHNLKTRIYGKETGHLPKYGELFESHLRNAVAESLKVEIGLAGHLEPERDEKRKVLYKSLPPECPFFQSFMAFSRVIPNDLKMRPIFVGDDGCLTRLRNAPFSLIGCKFNMGSSLGIASGLYRAGEKRKIVVLVGDSSFFHTAIPAYLDAVARGVQIMVVVLDNRCTAMTGCQANPGTDWALQGRAQKRIAIRSILQSPGIPLFREVNAFGDPRDLAAAFQECIESEDFAVLLVTGPCPNLKEKVC
ncbi:MAG: thiamine pyrophosphate-dependent enzyme [Deltaproteobacteria bacterium]|nr:thiamine pyrophosphate-dependent enzyme [Deltaproteobacteria bacterium]